jgi:hypothetical protein
MISSPTFAYPIELTNFHIFSTNLCLSRTPYSNSDALKYYICQQYFLQIIKLSSHLRQELLRVYCDALREINEIFGFEYFENSKVDMIAANFLEMLPFSEALLKSKRGVTLQELEKEEHDLKKAKDIAIRGILHGTILKYYNGNSFEEKFKDYVYSSGTETCEWIRKTGYDSYFNVVTNQVSKLVMNKDATKYIVDNLNISTRSRSQAIMGLFLTKPDFIKDLPNFNEKVIEDHVEVFKRLSGVAEKLFKLIYAIMNSYWTMPTPPNLDKMKFFEIWDAVRNDHTFNILAKAVPDTVCWNASKHDGYTKLVSSKQVKFKSNEGEITLSYSDFVSRVRELYACTLALTKISLIITFNLRRF